MYDTQYPRTAAREVIPVATLETKRKLEPKCVPHLFLKSLLKMRRSAELLANFLLHFSAGNSQNSLGKFTSFLKWRIAKTMKVAISRFDNAKPTIVMLIQLLTHSLVYVWQRVNTHKYSKDCP